MYTCQVMVAANLIIADGEALDDMGLWRNGRRSGLKIRSPKGRPGSSPGSPTKKKIIQRRMICELQALMNVC